MDTIAIIAKAIVTGASAGIENVASKAVHLAYSKVIGLLKRHDVQIDTTNHTAKDKSQRRALFDAVKSKIKIRQVSEDKELMEASLALLHEDLRSQLTANPRHQGKITWDDALTAAKLVLAQIEGSHWKPHIVIGLGRSGGLWGGWLAGNLGSVPIAVVDILYRKAASGYEVKDFPFGKEVISGISKRYKKPKVLVIEGAASTGKTFSEFRDRFKKSTSGWQIKFAVLYANPLVRFRIDFVGMVLEVWPKKFPWHLRPAYRSYLRDFFAFK